MCGQHTHIAALLSAQQRKTEKTNEDIFLPFVDVTCLPSQSPESDRPMLGALVWRSCSALPLWGDSSSREGCVSKLRTRNDFFPATL